MVGREKDRKEMERERGIQNLDDLLKKCRSKKDHGYSYQEVGDTLNSEPKLVTQSWINKCV